MPKDKPRGIITTEYSKLKVCREIRRAIYNSPLLPTKAALELFFVGALLYMVALQRKGELRLLSR